MTVGGFTHFPSREQLEDLRERLIAARPDVEATVELFTQLKLPAFERDTEYVALRTKGEYCYIDGEIASSDGGTFPLREYRKVTNEYLVQHSSAKRTKHKRESYMVGALARFNINFDELHPKAKSAAAAIGLKPKVTNPYLNTAAQVVEIVHCAEDAIRLCDVLLKRGIAWEDPAKPARMSGEGVGACDVPRGTLFHNYAIADGLVTGANCIIPTGQNLNNIEADMRALVPTLLDRKPPEITLALEMLVRAYDPCISCSTHMLDVRFE
jgi:coenzyme F420-reducing hydrogenase alpha subunit